MATLADLLRSGYTPPTESPMVDPIKQHIKSLPQKLQTNTAEQMALLGQAFPGNTYESMMTQGDPKAMAELAMQVPFNALTAFHGTPHKILGKFDMNKVGTGEGAQAYGHGMYFAENPAVAKEYQKMLRGPESTAQHYLELYKTPESAISAIQYELKPNLTAEAKKHSLDAIEVLKSGKELKGNLYKVDIPDADIPSMVNWDQQLKNQPDIVKTFIQNNIDELTADMHKFKPDSQNDVIWDKLKGIDLMTWANEKYGKPKAAELLGAEGIKGIRYLDEASRSKGKGTSNFVVFEPSTVKILEENAKPMNRKALIEEQVKKLKD